MTKINNSYSLKSDRPFDINFLRIFTCNLNLNGCDTSIVLNG
ncbi:MAG: hypothetical protein ACKPH9_25310 [Dolichospermum sp.]